MILAKEFNRSSIARDCGARLLFPPPPPFYTYYYSSLGLLCSADMQCTDFTISTQGPQPPTIVQFGANVPQELARASSLVAPYVNGIDLNCGCPQSWACAETLGAALMEERALVRDLVLETRQRLRDDGWAVGKEKDISSPKGRSVSVKIRIHKDLR